MKSGAPVGERLNYQLLLRRDAAALTHIRTEYANILLQFMRRPKTPGLLMSLDNLSFIGLGWTHLPGVPTTVSTMLAFSQFESSHPVCPLCDESQVPPPSERLEKLRMDLRLVNRQDYSSNIMMFHATFVRIMVSIGDSLSIASSCGAHSKCILPYKEQSGWYTFRPWHRKWKRQSCLRLTLYEVDRVMPVDASAVDNPVVNIVGQYLNSD
jgi:hypothetical protein